MRIQPGRFNAKNWRAVNGVEIDAQVNIATADVWGPGGEFILQWMDWC